MPQLVVVAIAGAGLIAGYKWLSKKLDEQMKAAPIRERADASASSGPREMGALEWDSEAQVYRPVRRSM